MIFLIKRLQNDVICDKMLLIDRLGKHLEGYAELGFGDVKIKAFGKYCDFSFANLYGYLNCIVLFKLTELIRKYHI